jgi:multisubunit Na+/H+ antiporter MnhE subunit
MMKKLMAAGLLVVNFLKEAIVSGWITALIILRGGNELQSGLIRMSYGELSDSAANFLGALITLTPGTTTIDIDLQHKEFLLHLLDAKKADETLKAIQHDFLQPVRTLFGDNL